MSLAMTREEREAFLADVHVGVLCIEVPGEAPLSAPVWYDYAPDVGLWFVTQESSRKGRALKAAGRCTLVAQSEVAPNYKYVSVTGPVVDVRPSDDEKHRRPMARRYLGKELGDRYVASVSGEGDVLFSMRPERWLTVDYTKSGLA
jgi:nitroimidazol reductase NimA-like FMN-containing flavoprotein (pyridoxamine 5'-phosphate oxidase superfamily)